MEKSINLKIFALLFSLVICFSFFAQIALATYGLEYASVSNLGTRPLKQTVFTIINIILGFLGIIVIVGIIFGGLTMMTSGGNEKKRGTGQRVVIGSLIGLAIILAAWAIAQFVLSNLMSATT